MLSVSGDRLVNALVQMIQVELVAKDCDALSSFLSLQPILLFEISLKLALSGMDAFHVVEEAGRNFGKSNLIDFLDLSSWAGWTVGKSWRLYSCMRCISYREVLAAWNLVIKAQSIRTLVNRVHSSASDI